MWSDESLPRCLPLVKHLGVELTSIMELAEFGARLHHQQVQYLRVTVFRPVAA